MALLSRFLVLALLLVGCSVQPVYSPPLCLQLVSENDSLASYHQWLSRATADAVEEARATYRRTAEAGSEERLRYALLLSFDENSPTPDLHTARTLITEVLEEDPELPSRHADFARLWNAVLGLRLELRKTMSRQADTIESLQRRNEELARQADSIEALQKRNEELTRQIEALTVIEEQLNQREQQEPEQ